MKDDEITEQMIARLPKWAQAERKHLMMRLNEARVEIASRTIAATEDSHIVVNPYSTYPYVIDQDAHIRFNLDRLNAFDVRLIAHQGHYTGIEVMACGRLSGGINAAPRASNIFILRPEKW